MPLDTFVGHKFGMLTVKSFEQRQEKGQRRWWALCQCDCGKEKWIRWQPIRAGITSSCGCNQYKKAESTRKLRASKLVETNGEKIAWRYALNPALTMEDVREEFGVTRQYVSQCVQRFISLGSDERKNVIERKQRAIQMLDEYQELLEENERLCAELQAARSGRK